MAFAMILHTSSSNHEQQGCEKQSKTHSHVFVYKTNCCPVDRGMKAERERWGQEVGINCPVTRALDIHSHICALISEYMTSEHSPHSHFYGQSHC